MRSIRVQLLGWLLPGFVVVCVVAIMGVYFSAKQANDADLDARLGRLAGSARLALRNQANAGTGGTRTPGLRAFLAKEDFQSPGQYFELWTSDGVPERRSPNLGNADLPRPPELTRDAIRYDGTLENGERVRVSAMQYPQGGGSPPLAFAVALSRSEGEARLSRLLTDLAMGGVACCAVLCLLLVLALRFALRPLARVGEQAVAMGAASLHERFTVEAMPQEIAPIVARLNDLMARLEASSASAGSAVTWRMSCAHRSPRFEPRVKWRRNGRSNPRRRTFMKSLSLRHACNTPWTASWCCPASKRPRLMSLPKRWCSARSLMSVSRCTWTAPTRAI
jgi:hypothetical protein